MMLDFWFGLVVAFVVVDKLWPFVESLLQSFLQGNSKKLKELVRERQQLQSQQKEISAQDQYAKWTKNNRKLENLNKEIDMEKKAMLAQFEKGKSSLKKVKLGLITIPFTLLKFYKGKMPIYQLPKGIFPNFLQGMFEHGWMYAALGPLNMKQVSNGATVSVSLGIWLFALLKVVATVEEIWSSLTQPVPEITKVGVEVHNAEVAEEQPSSEPVD